LERYVAFGTTADWLAGTTVPIATSSVSGPMNLVGALTALGLLIPLLHQISRSRRLRSL
jgi:hypothetical protein